MRKGSKEKKGFTPLIQSVILILVNGIIKVLNKIPGVEIDTVEAATFADDFAGKMANNIIATEG